LNPDIRQYNHDQQIGDQEICQLLAEQIEPALPEAGSRFWHSHPVWLLNGNPVVGYGKLKDCARLLFWSI